MTMMINKMIQKALQVDTPTEVQPEPTILPVVVEPHELPAPVENPSLPNMDDINRRQAEGEKQLEEMITLGQAIVRQFYEDELPNADPRAKRGIMEQLSAMFGNTLTAIIHKNKLQLDKKEGRMAEAAFTRKQSEAGGGGQHTTNMFFGTQEQMREALKQGGFIEEEK